MAYVMVGVVLFVSGIVVGFKVSNKQWKDETDQIRLMSGDYFSRLVNAVDFRLYSGHESLERVATELTVLLWNYMEVYGHRPIVDSRARTFIDFVAEKKGFESVGFYMGGGVSGETDKVHLRELNSIYELSYKYDLTQPFPPWADWDEEYWVPQDW